jgi:hypothetical protein
MDGCEESSCRQRYAAVVDLMSRTIARMSLFGIAASSDLHAPLAEPCGFRLAAIDDRFARVEVSDHREHAITRAASSRKLDRVLALAVLDGDPAELSELLECRVAAEPAPPAVLDASERHRWFVVDSRVVDVAHARV